jgi:DNA-damage-inducible protein J
VGQLRAAAFAIRLLLVRIAREKALPFEVKVPNNETIAAMEEARRGEGKKHRSVAEMMKGLNADDPAD